MHRHARRERPDLPRRETSERGAPNTEGIDFETAGIHCLRPGRPSEALGSPALHIHRRMRSVMNSAAVGAHRAALRRAEWLIGPVTLILLIRRKAGPCR
jgi:hypothetical protein